MSVGPVLRRSLTQVLKETVWCFEDNLQYMDSLMKAKYYEIRKTNAQQIQRKHYDYKKMFLNIHVPRSIREKFENIVREGNYKCNSSL